MFTKDKRFAGCNDIAKKYVKELNNMNIDSLINSENQFFSRLIAEMGYMGDKDQEAWHQKLNGKEIKCILRYLFYNDKKSGYMLELVDDTKQREYINLMNNYNNELENAVMRKTNSMNELQNKIL
jgi:hypothetical protein